MNDPTKNLATETLTQAEAQEDDALDEKDLEGVAGGISAGISTENDIAKAAKLTTSGSGPSG